MCMVTGVLLLWAVTTAPGLSTSLKCARLARQATPLKRFRDCTVTIEHGYINAVCKIAVGWREKRDDNTETSKAASALFLNDTETLTIEQMLVSDEPLGGVTQGGGIVCLSLRSTTIKKGDSLAPGKCQRDAWILTPEDSIFGRPGFQYLLNSVRQMTIKSTFGVPPQAAVAVCDWNSAAGRSNFEIYGFTDRYPYNLTYSPHFGTYFGLYINNIDHKYHESIYRVLPINDESANRNVYFAFLEFWKGKYFRTEVVNVTLASIVEKLSADLHTYLHNIRTEHLLFYKCNFYNVEGGDLEEVRNLKRLEFILTSLQNVDPLALSSMPNLAHSSFIGTHLPGIPQAIFDLRQLDTLDMSDTNVPRDTQFQYCPENCQRNSTVKQLILSGSNLDSLPNRAFCGFPLLKTLELESCHIGRLSGSPFECLESLGSLTMARNNIRSLDGKNVKGLKNLVFLDVSKNRIAYFEGPQIFSTLISLRSLMLFQNDIKDLLLGPWGYGHIEKLNLAHNQISKWNPPLFTRMAKLETLLLQHNGLPALSEAMWHDISHVKYVNLSWNPWDCSSSQLKNLRSLLKKHPEQSTNSFICNEPDQLEGMSVVEALRIMDDGGPPNYFEVHGVPALISIIIASLVGYAVYRYRWYCMYGLLYLKLAMKGRRREANAGRFLWDGFLSYPALDTGWVRDVFLPKLESAPMSFRLCVAERDFIPGLPITENICRAITQSRVSFFLVSREFCRSRWCMFELSLAHHRLFENDRRDGIVLIRKNDLDESEMSSMLAYLLKSRTYVQLPPDGSSEALNNLFWLQIQAALEK